MEIEFFLVESIEDIGKNHFIVYNPQHKKGDAWFYEYNSIEEFLFDGWRYEDLNRFIGLGYVRVVNEVETWV